MSERTVTPSVSEVADIASERHWHYPYRRVRFNYAECGCGAVLKEWYGAWREVGRWRYWRLKRKGLFRD
jgi:hypothetical protein